MSKDVERLYVSKPFKIKLKEVAMKNDMSVIEFTNALSKLDDPFEPLMNKKRRRIKFDFP